MKVKICGIKNKEELHTVLKFQPDAVGFICGITHYSEDAITPEEVKNLVKEVPPFITPVLVTHLVSLSEIVKLVSTVGITTIQLQGDVSPENITCLKTAFPYIKVIKAVHVTSKEAIEVAKLYESTVDAILLDSRTQNRLGGTGLTHDWNISRKIVEIIKVPVILAGGLNPENVKQAIQTVKPYGVDANSGLKGENNLKDPNKVKNFILAAKCSEFW